MTFWQLATGVMLSGVGLCYLIIFRLLIKARRQRRRDS